MAPRFCWSCSSFRARFGFVERALAFVQASMSSRCCDRQSGGSFLGFGVQPPQNSWGRMLSDTEGYATSPDKFYLVLFPGLALLLTVLAVNFLGDALRDAFDPKSRK